LTLAKLSYLHYIYITNVIGQTIIIALYLRYYCHWPNYHNDTISTLLLTLAKLS